MKLSEKKILLTFHEEVSKNLTIPIVACGGAGNLEHIKKVIDSGASAAAGGSMFVYHGNLKGFLITYPSREKLEILFK